MGQMCWFVKRCIEASEAGSVWPVSGSRQCLEVGRRWLNDRELEQEEEQEEEENKEDRVPSCSQRALQACWPGCVLLLLFILTYANNTGHCS